MLSGVKLTDWLMLLTSLAYVLVTCGMLGAVRRQAEIAKEAAEAAKKSAEIAEQSLKITQRADVLVEGVSILPKPESGVGDPHNRVEIRFRNFGNTRALNVKLNVHLTIPELERSDLSLVAPVTIGAGGSQTIAFESFGKWLTADTARKITAGDVPLTFVGEVSYDDVFAVRHVARCSGVYVPVIRSFRVDGKSTD